MLRITGDPFSFRTAFSRGSYVGRRVWLPAVIGWLFAGAGMALTVLWLPAAIVVAAGFALMGVGVVRGVRTSRDAPLRPPPAIAVSVWTAIVWTLVLAPPFLVVGALVLLVYAVMA